MRGCALCTLPAVRSQSTGCGRPHWLRTAGSVHNAQARRACRLGNHGTWGPAWLKRTQSDSLFLFSAAEFQFLRNVFYSHCAWTTYLKIINKGKTHLDCCTAVPCSPRTWIGRLHGGRYFKVAPRLNKVLLRVRPSFRCESRRALDTAIALLPTGQ